MDDLLQTVVNAGDGRRHSDASIDMKLEAIVIPVSDVDRTKEFYTRLGWRLDADFAGKGSRSRGQRNRCGAETWAICSNHCGS